MASGRRTSLSGGDARVKRSAGSARGGAKAPGRNGSNAAGRSGSNAAGRNGSNAVGRNGSKAAGRDVAQQVAPLYKRLPHGPHRLERKEVVANQRTRIHGAMIEAVARNGYDQTSVKEVIGLAGVSRRSFYEQFANKEGCFLATFDLIARRELQQIRRTYLDGEGTLAQRARASFDRLARTVSEDRKASVLVVLEAQTAGVPGVERLLKATGACEHMLVQSFAQADDAVSLPIPIVRAMTGGLHGATEAFLRERPDACAGEITDELLGWTLQFQAPAAERMGERMGAALSLRLREIASAYGNGRGGAEGGSRDARTRVLQGVLRLAAGEGYQNLSAPRIADEANVPIDTFCELFADSDDCFLAALDAIGDELLMIVADPGLVHDDWPGAVRRVLAELMRYLADHPLQARTLAQEAFFAGTEAREHVRYLSHSVATLLTEGAPGKARGEFTTEAIAGAIWHTIRSQVAAGRIPLLAALPDHLAYIVLTPYIGAEAAAELLTQEDRPAERDSGASAAAC
jgi:AcrR family transcriptional regulator